MYLRTIALLAALAASAVAKTIAIDVGKTGLVFSPDTSTADVGDILEFHFYSNAHTVVQGDFSTPCQVGSLGSSGFGSGPVKADANSGTVFQVTVKSTDPIWFYCSIPSHCPAGMVGVVNPPAQGNTLDSYRSAAKSASTAQGVSSAQGGTLGTAGSGSSGTSATAAATSGSGTPAPTTTGSGTSAPSSVSASQTKASSTASATAAATTTSGGMALMETSEKIALTSVLVGLGLLVMLMV